MLPIVLHGLDAVEASGNLVNVGLHLVTPVVSDNCQSCLGPLVPHAGQRASPHLHNGERRKRRVLLAGSASSTWLWSHIRSSTYRVATGDGACCQQNQAGIKHVSSACHQQMAPGVMLAIGLGGLSVHDVHWGVCPVWRRVLERRVMKRRKPKCKCLEKYFKDAERKDESEPKAINIYSSLMKPSFTQITPLATSVPTHWIYQRASTQPAQLSSLGAV